MKKIPQLLAFCCSFITFSAIAAEENPYYVEFGFGRSNGYVPYTGELPSGRYSGASAFNIALGKQFNEYIAFDVDLTYRGDYINNDDDVYTDHNTQKGTVTLTSLSSMLNGYYYYYNKIPNFRPYITGGIGISQNKTSNQTISGTDINGDQLTNVSEKKTTISFSWKLGTGIKYKLDNRFEVDLRYQYVDLGNVDSSNTSSAYINGIYQKTTIGTTQSSRLSAHEILVGIIYKF